jgi:hypothetical protein
LIILDENASIVRVLKLMDIPIQLAIVDFGSVFSYHSSIMLLAHLKNNDLLLYDIQDFNIFKQYKGVYRFIIQDFLGIGHDQLLIDFSNSMGLNTYILVVNTLEEYRRDNDQVKHTSLSKPQHLYSVLRALHTRLEDAEQSILQELDRLKEKKQLIQHEELILKRITNTGTNGKNISFNFKRINNNTSGLIIPYGSTAPNEWTPVMQQIHNISPIPKIIQPHIEQNELSMGDNRPIVTSAHQYFSAEEWRVDLILKFPNNSDFTLSNIQCIPFASNCTINSRVYKRWLSENSKTILSLSIIVPTPPNFANRDTHLHLILAMKEAENELYKWLGTICPTNTQKLLSLQKAHLPLKKHNFVDAPECKLLFLRHQKQQILERETVYSLLIYTLEKCIGMKKVDGYDNQRIIFQFNDNDMYQVILESLQTQDLIQCTLKTTNTNEEHLLVLLQLILDQLPKSICALPLDIHLDIFSESISGLLSEVSIICNDTSNNEQIQHNFLMNLNLINDFTIARLLYRTPCKLFPYSKILK